MFSCSDDDDQASEVQVQSLVFGSFTGECFGDCFDVFKIDGTKLEEDRIVDFYTQNYSFKGSFTFPGEEFMKHQSILNEIPAELIEGSDKTFGCPDCADQGGVYLVITIGDGKTINYLIDTDDTEDQSTEITTFKKKIFEIIIELTGALN
ncbi:hypothetical protein GCM10022258_23490 [Aquimarina gracilis]